MIKKLVTKEDLDSLLEIVELRNITSHVYDEELAQQLSKKISSYYPVMDKLTKSIHISE